MGTFSELHLIITDNKVSRKGMGGGGERSPEFKRSPQAKKETEFDPFYATISAAYIDR